MFPGDGAVDVGRGVVGSTVGGPTTVWAPWSYGAGTSVLDQQARTGTEPSTCQNMANDAAGGVWGDEVAPCVPGMVVDRARACSRHRSMTVLVGGADLLWRRD